MSFTDNLQETLADAVMNRPREFFIGKKRFCLWSPSLGMSIMIERQIKTLDIDFDKLRINPSYEALRLATLKKDELCHILSIHTFKTYDSFCDSRILERRARMFAKDLSYEEVATLALYILSEPKAESLIASSGIEKEQNEMSRITRYKNKDGHSRMFGGKTVYGTLIDTACAKYGWTKEYVVWGIDLVSLRMMLADAVNSIYLSDEDLKGLNISNTKHEVYGMTQDDINRLKTMDWT